MFDVVIVEIEIDRSERARKGAARQIARSIVVAKPKVVGVGELFDGGRDSGGSRVRYDQKGDVLFVGQGRLEDPVDGGVIGQPFQSQIRQRRSQTRRPERAEIGDGDGDARQRRQEGHAPEFLQRSAVHVQISQVGKRGQEAEIEAVENAIVEG